MVVDNNAHYRPHADAFACNGCTAPHGAVASAHVEPPGHRRQHCPHQRARE